MKPMKTSLSLITALFIIVFLSACGQGSSPGSPTGERALKPTEDRAGYPIEVPDTQDKIITMAPAFTQTLVDLGLGDNIIAIDEYSVGLEGIAPNLPTFDMLQPDVERIVALAPDIVFFSGMSLISGDNPYKPISDMGICVICVPSSDDIAGIKEDMLFIGAVTGRQAEAGSLVSGMDREIERVKEISEAIADKKTVYFELSAAPWLYSFGQGVFLNEMIELAGGVNIFAHEDSWISVSEEAVISLDPDVILTNVDFMPDPVGEIKTRNGWDGITAVKEDQVYFIQKNPSSLPNHNVVLALVEMAERLYPELYPGQ